MSERIFTPDELGQGFRKNAEAIEALQQQIKVQQKQIEVLYKILGVKYE